MNSRPRFFFPTLSLHWFLISFVAHSTIMSASNKYFSVIGYQIIETMNPKTLELTQELPTRKDKSE